MTGPCGDAKVLNDPSFTRSRRASPKYASIAVAGQSPAPVMNKIADRRFWLAMQRKPDRFDTSFGY
jgi:hypothetical protein